MLCVSYYLSFVSGNMFAFVAGPDASQVDRSMELIESNHLDVLTCKGQRPFPPSSWVMQNSQWPLWGGGGGWRFEQ